MSRRPSRFAATFAAWRIARRDAMRHKGRSLLVIVMIGLPVAGVVFADVVWRTGDRSPAQQAEAVLGERADALLTDTRATSVTQLPDPGEGWSSTEPREEPLDLEAVLPSSWSWVISDNPGEAPFLSADGDRVAPAMLQEVRYADPLLAGLVRQLEGRAPSGDGEVALTVSLADRLDLGVGDQLVATGGAGTYDIVGVVEIPQALNDTRVFADPGAFTRLLGGEPADGGFVDVYVDAGGPVTWEQVPELNAEGLLVTSRAVLLDPPSCSEDVPCGDFQFGIEAGLSAEAITLIGLLLAMALLQVVLLSGPAFAIGRRTQSRDLALVAASGGDRRHVGGIVRGGGVVLGGLGAVVGAVLAIVGFLVFKPQLSSLNGSDLPTIDLRPLDIGLIIAVGVGTGLVAAWLPARQASRQDVVTALAGRRPTPRVPRRVPLLGAVAVVIGAVITLYGAGPGDSIAIVLGSVVAQLGLVAMSPTLVALVARIGPRLPAVPRLALRDAARSRGRSGPAVAAVMAAIAGAVAVSIFAASQEAADERGYIASAPTGWAAVGTAYTGDSSDGGGTAAAVTTVEATLPVERTYLIQGHAPDPATCSTENPCEQLAFVVAEENQCPLFQGGTTQAPTAAQTARFAEDPRCVRPGRAYVTPFGEYLVGDAETLFALTGTTDDAARRALDAGGVVVFDADVVLDGQVTLQVTAIDQAAGGDRPDVPAGGDRPDVLREESLPAALMTPEIRPAVAYLSPAAAEQLGLDVRTTGALFETSRMPTQDEQDRANRQLEFAAQGQPPSLVVERGYQNDTGIFLLALIGVTAVIALGATAIAVGLAAADAKPDLATLAAVGAGPRTRRLLTASQALVIAGLGTILGIAAGFVPGIAAVRTQSDWSAPYTGFGDPPTLPVEVPWTNLALLLVVVPLLAAICGALFSRSRLPMVRRLT